jgi:hypothetical protein
VFFDLKKHFHCQNLNVKKQVFKKCYGDLRTVEKNANKMQKAKAKAKARKM